jgi:hypothetical protein
MGISLKKQGVSFGPKKTGSFFSNFSRSAAAVTYRPARVRQKKKWVTPVVGGWVAGKKRTRVRFIFSIFFYRVFELPSPRNAQKRDNKIEKSGFWIFGRIFCKSFWTRFVLQNVFCSVFELPSLRNTRKRDETKKVEEQLTSICFRFFWKKLSTWTFCKNAFVVFLNSPCRETPKNVLKKKSRKKVGWWVGGSGI